MVKLLIIADDFTGALDTAIHFADGGSGRTVVFLEPEILWDFLPPETQVVVVNTDSRHLSGPQAYQLTAELADQARQRQVPVVFKKVDSAFRGNPGPELQAVLEQSEAERLYLLPAFPDGGRTTEGGIQLWDGVPISETAYGRDPFAPVLDSDIASLLSGQASLSVEKVPIGAEIPTRIKGVVLLDAQNNGQIQERCRQLLTLEQPLLLGGCAGLSKALAGILFPAPGCNVPALPCRPEKLLVVSGSLHAVSRNQLRWARDRGIPYFALEVDKHLAPGFLNTPEGLRFLSQVRIAWQQKDVILLETAPGALDPSMRGSVSEQIATVAEAVYRTLPIGNEAALAVFGGDTLLKIAQRCLQDGIYPLYEIEAGVPLSLATDRGGCLIPVVSKSGGLGTEPVIRTLLHRICGKDIGG